MTDSSEYRHIAFGICWDFFPLSKRVRLKGQPHTCFQSITQMNLLILSKRRPAHSNLLVITVPPGFVIIKNPRRARQGSVLDLRLELLGESWKSKVRLRR